MSSKLNWMLVVSCLVGNFLITSFACSQQSDQSHADAIEAVLRPLAGENISIPPAQGFLVVSFLGIECPLGKLYAPRINQIASEFESKGFQFVAVNSNRQDSTQEWRQFAKTTKLDLPIVKDHDNLIADKLGVVRNPDVLVIDTEGKIRYRGRIDDQYSPGIARSKVTREDLRIALTELSESKTVSVPATEPEGCLIGRIKQPAENATVTYAQHIAPIFQTHCVECHRSGEIGPFAMIDYDEVVGWADMIVETIDNGRMPPWHAEPTIGKFANARGLSESEKQLIRTWVDEGAQLGDPNKLPASFEFTSGWRLPRAPDLVLPMRSKPFEIPADGSVEYQYFVVDPGFEEDKWVSAAEIIPGNRGVVHHSIVFIRPPDGQRGNGLNWLEAYVPGQIPVKHVGTRARKIPAGSKLVFQQHYTPNGQRQSDLTKIGLLFVDEELVQEELITLAALNQEFEIQPHQSDLTVTAEIPWLPRGGKLLSISPHMHYRGKSFVALADDGESNRPILGVPNYDFNWQHNYELEEPLPLKQFKKIEVQIAFDNSAANPFNPDPDQYVVWGDQTWEEMAIGFFNVAVPRHPEVKVAETEDHPIIESTEVAPTTPVYSKSTLRRAKQHVAALFDSNDDNGDKRLIQEELPNLSRQFFRAYDQNNDGFATVEEVEVQARIVYHHKEKLNQ